MGDFVLDVLNGVVDSGSVVVERRVGDLDDSPRGVEVVSVQHEPASEILEGSLSEAGESGGLVDDGHGVEQPVHRLRDEHRFDGLLFVVYKRL